MKLPFELNKKNIIIISVGVIVIVVGIWYMTHKSNPSKAQHNGMAEVRHSLPPQRHVEEQPSGGINPPTVVFFHAEWCGVCKHIKPDWEEAKKHLAANRVRVIEMEHSTHKDEIESNDIKGYPTIRLYPEGYPGMYTEYTGDRSTRSIVNFVKESLTSPPKQVRFADPVSEAPPMRDMVMPDQRGGYNPPEEGYVDPRALGSAYTDMGGKKL